MSEMSRGEPPVPRPVRGVHPLRVAWRLSAIVAWTAIFYVASVALALVDRITPIPEVRRRTSIAWANGLSAITGMRLEVHGAPPAKPFFLVSNHVVWLDGFATIRLFDCTYVGMAEIQSMWFVRTIISGFRPIYVRRSKEDTPRVVGLMAEELQRGGSLFMCPEAVISPGREVRRFHGGLLEAAVRTNTPVHYVTITYRTPEDCPRPSHCLLFGPDPYFRTPDGKIPESELAVWGPERSTWTYLLRFLSVRTYTVVLTFGAEPIRGTNKNDLANALCEAVRAQFVPVE